MTICINYTKKYLSLLLICIIIQLFFWVCTKEQPYEPHQLVIVTDIDGNTYQTIRIGQQIWMTQNLKVTRYRNGDAIPNVIGNREWSNLLSGAYCEYYNDTDRVATYGRLYNWYAVNDSRNIAPKGWHVPSDTEWKKLEMYLGMSQGDADTVGYRGTDEGGKLKETGTLFWSSSNTGATNESGFTALPGGDRMPDGRYFNMFKLGLFWSSSEFSNDYAVFRVLNFDKSLVRRGNNSKQLGLSVRCVKDLIDY